MHCLKQIWTVFWLYLPVIDRNVFLNFIFFYYYFIRDLSKCLALWGRCGQTWGRADRQALRQVRLWMRLAVSPISAPALQSYWTLRLPSLHRALWMRPQNSDRRVLGCNRSSPTVLFLPTGVVWITVFKNKSLWETKIKWKNDRNKNESLNSTVCLYFEWAGAL